MGKIIVLMKNACFNPCPLLRTLRANFLRGRSTRMDRGLMLFSSFSICDIHPSARLNIRNRSIFGFKKYWGSRIETSLWMDADSEFNIGSGLGSVSIYHGCDIQIFKGARLSIGGRCVMNRSAQVICQDEITIGEDCMISRDVVIRDNDGGHTIMVDGYKKSSPVHIGNHVWIGQGAIILKGSTIGDGAIIGAGAVVFGKVKPGALVMADPSRTFAKDVKWER